MTNTLLHSPVARRGLLGALVAASTGRAVAAGGTAPAATPASTGPARSQAQVDALARERLRERRAPNVPLLDQHGRTVHFYDDVIKGRKVLINVMYTVCSNICTPATRNLIEARQLLGGQARDIQFVSMSLTPLTDGPEQLRAYKKQHGIDDDWLFLTGPVAHVEKVQRGLGFLTDRPEEDLLSHSAIAMFCDERQLRWSHANTLLSPRSIARMLRFELA